MLYFYYWTLTTSLRKIKAQLHIQNKTKDLIFLIASVLYTDDEYHYDH